MKILNVVSILSSDEGGGNAERTAQISNFLAARGNYCKIMTLNIGELVNVKSNINNVDLVIIPSIWKRFQVPKIDLKRIKSEVEQADIIHLIGYWSLLGCLVVFLARKAKIPYVVCPAGALPIFGRTKFFKLLFNLLFGYRLIKKASGWIAVTPRELTDFQDYGIPSNKVRVIPNGVRELRYNDISNTKITYKFKSEFSILFMGRLNFIKGPDLLLEAFCSIEKEFPDLLLIFAGQDEGLKNDLLRLAEEQGVDKKVKFLGFISGEEKITAYQKASLLVVPSRSEAMSIVAVEAGSYGTPVLLTNKCGLNDIAEVDPRLIVEPTAKSLAEGLKYALNDQDRLQTWGLTWKDLVNERFLWKDSVSRLNEYLIEIIAVKEK